MCQNIEANVCQYFFEGEVQVRWVFSSILDMQFPCGNENLQ